MTADEIVKGVEKLNLAFVANLFNKHPALDPVEDVEDLGIKETREEKSKKTFAVCIMSCLCISRCWCTLNINSPCQYSLTFHSVPQLDELTWC